MFIQIHVQLSYVEMCVVFPLIVPKQNPIHSCK